MPHVIVKLWPGKSEEQKAQLVAKIVEAVTSALDSKESSVSVSLEEIESGEWKEKVYEPDILAKPETLYRKPGYVM